MRRTFTAIFGIIGKHICNQLYTRNRNIIQFVNLQMVSSKFLYDYGEESGVVMSEWAESGGISIDELVALEREFLSSIVSKIF